MDITAPSRQATPATSQEADNQPLAVHAAPAVTDEDQGKEDVSVDNSISQQEPETSDVPGTEQQPQQKTAQPLPVVAITLAVLAMLGLSAIAIVIYLNS